MVSLCNAVDYAMKEGYKLSWKGALVGGAITTAMGIKSAEELMKKDRSSGIVAVMIWIAAPILGITAGALGGFACGATKGMVQWAVSGPFDPHSDNDASVQVGAHVTAIVANFVSDCLSNDD